MPNITRKFSERYGYTNTGRQRIPGYTKHSSALLDQDNPNIYYIAFKKDEPNEGAPYVIEGYDGNMLMLTELAPNLSFDTLVAFALKLCDVIGDK